MVKIAASLVKELRERTGLGMMECKRALADANGNIEQAIDELRKTSGLKAAKKAGRTAADGVIALKVIDNLLSKNASELAAVIIEPLIQGASGMKICRPDFLDEVVNKFQSNDVLVIFD